MFLSLPLVARRRSKGRSISVQPSPDQWSTPLVNNQTEVSVSIAGTDIPVIQLDQHNMAGLEEMMR